MITLTAALFAGGESRRMGTDKALLPWDGKPLWQRQRETLRQLGPQRLIISAREVPAWCPPGWEVILDSPLARGPMAGLIGVLEALQTSHVLILAVDMPQMTAEHLQKLVATARPGCGVVPACGDSMEPLGAIYPAEALQTAKTSLPSNFSLNRLIETLIEVGRMQKFPVAESERELYHNVNSPADIQV
jgi:molybdopterin-guanine dinucleotide biosynthesis protein A